MKKNLTIFLMMLFFSIFQRITYGQTIAATNTGTNGQSTAPAGWTLILGSPDIVSVGNPNTGSWLCTVPSPPNGHSTWMAGVSGGVTERSSTVITGMTAGVTYLIEFYVGNFHGDNGFWGFPNVGLNGEIDIVVDNVAQSTAVFSSSICEWKLVSFSYTATASTATLTQVGRPIGTTYFWWHMSLASSSVVLLPINVANLSGQKKDAANVLKWETNSELNSDHFLLEKSQDGMTFEPIAKIATKGAVNLTTNYHFVDENPFLRENYYRLKMVDLNGSYRYSKIIMIDFGITNGQAMLVYPNPAKNELNLSCHINEGSEFVLEIIDVLGEVVEQRQLSMVEGVNNFVLPLENYAVGTYLLRITNGLISKTQLFIKE